MWIGIKNVLRDFSRSVSNSWPVQNNGSKTWTVEHTPGDHFLPQHWRLETESETDTEKAQCSPSMIGWKWYWQNRSKMATINKWQCVMTTTPSPTVELFCVNAQHFCLPSTTASALQACCVPLDQRGRCGIVGFNVPLRHSTHYRSFRRRFYGSHDPTNNVTALKDDG